MEIFNISVNQIQSGNSLLPSIFARIALSFPHWLGMPIGFSILFLRSFHFFWCWYLTAVITELWDIFVHIRYDRHQETLKFRLFFLQIFFSISSHLFSQINVRFILSTSLQKLNEIWLQLWKVHRWVWGTLTLWWHQVFLSWNQVWPLFSKVWDLFFMIVKILP